MINRELIRIKIVQLTYAYYQNGTKNLDNAEKELLFSLSKAYDRYNYMLLLIIALTHEEHERVDLLVKRAEREGTEAPSDKFICNKFVSQLESNKMLNEFCEQQKLTWSNDVEVLRKLCMQIEQSAIYNDYMSNNDNSYDADRDLWVKIYKQIIEDSEDLNQILEEKSLYWNDDKEVVDTFVLKTIKRFEEANKDDQQLLPEFKDDDDRDFALKLFRSTIINADQYQRYMSETSRNWDFSRLAYMDVIIMQIAIAEMLNFPNIPISVTINEYVELAKVYSTPRSGAYINGMLDAIARYLIHTGTLLKPIDPPHNVIQQPETGNENVHRSRFVHSDKKVDKNTTVTDNVDNSSN
jgi:N utilization substance protein B